MDSAYFNKEILEATLSTNKSISSVARLNPWRTIAIPPITTYFAPCSFSELQIFMRSLGLRSLDASSSDTINSPFDLFASS